MRLSFVIFTDIAKLNTLEMFLQSLNREIKYQQNVIFFQSQNEVHAKFKALSGKVE